jgi:hypothetical protein
MVLVVVVVVMAVCDVVEWGSRGMVKARGEGTVRVWVWGGGEGSPRHRPPGCWCMRGTGQRHCS